MTGQQALAQAIRTLQAAGVENASRDARWILAWALQIDRGALAGRLTDALDARSNERFQAAVMQRAQRIPFSHISGAREFWGREFIVTPDVLDPRPETELLIELALQSSFSRILDLGTGSGAILVTLLAERATAQGVGTDISEKAVLVAGKNALRHGVADRVVLPLSDWFDDVGGLYDLIVSNPPYIAASQMPCLAPEVRNHEPRIALTDEGDGLGAYRTIAERLRWCLSAKGRVLLEIGPTQGPAVTELLTAAGLCDAAIHTDLDGRARVVSATAPTRNHCRASTSQDFR